ncbi:MAG: phosphopantothenate/pantothenate synthetase [Promethearchaeota archaeon]|nr:MAG: phosphopantothenate/pantothenate synthetase [Candidatus Lokiarchaeota archaeon]
MKEKRNRNNSVPKDHPRYKSLKYRHKIIEGMKNLVVAEAGLIAHGRGECFDYIFGEKTNETAKKAIKAAVAQLMISNKPIISVNGNVAALVPKELVKLSKTLNIPLEINLFYRKEGRIEAIKNLLEKSGAKEILGLDQNKMVEIEELSSNRRLVDPKGIKIADTVFVPLEDGDRTEALKKIGKKVIAVDLNPISRTAIWADITIIDNIIRALPEMIKIAKDLKNLKKEQLITILNNFNNKKNIIDTLDLIKEYIEAQKENAFKILKS